MNHTAKPFSKIDHTRGPSIGQLVATWMSLLLIICATPSYGSISQSQQSAPVIAALLGETPLISDFRQLVDEIGGRPTGSRANERAIVWALERFQEAGVNAWTEDFTMPSSWFERRASAMVHGPGVSFTPRVAAMPFSTGTRGNDLEAPLVDVGHGTEEDFMRIGTRARGAIVLVDTDELTDLASLFHEYAINPGIESRAIETGAVGIVYVGSRPGNQLYRHNVSAAARGRMPVLAVERDGGRRMLRLLRAGKPLTMALQIEIDQGGAYISQNVVGEIRGATKPDEILIFGAHLDSWDLGTGALDNGANVAMLIDIARQISRLRVRPSRTIRFVLWNGEEQGMIGSWQYIRAHQAELDKHVIAVSFDIGCGRITGFYTGGRSELISMIDRALAPVSGLGPFIHQDVPIVGTDNYDFMVEGIANLVAVQESGLYGPNYHARSDEYERCDLTQLKLNSTISASLVLGMANSASLPRRQSRAQLMQLIARTGLRGEMGPDLWRLWENGERGRSQK